MQAICDLPVTLLAEMLKHVPLKERLSACALVCPAFASAAALSTTHLEILLPLQNVASFESWTQHHAEQCVSLKIGPKDHAHGCSLQLPWEQLTRLQVLDISAVHLQLPGTEDDTYSLQSEEEEAGGTDQHPGTSTNISSGSKQLQAQEPPAAATDQHTSTSSPRPLLPCLQKLRLFNCGPLWPAGLLQLTRGCKLVSLQLSDDRSGMELAFLFYVTEVPKQQLHGAFDELLLQQPGLTCLHLRFLDVGPAAVQHLSNMTRLQVSVKRSAPLWVC
jgi:hypothetical protein